jgi:ketosteroid isomerase-like protein
MKYRLLPVYVIAWYAMRALLLADGQTAPSSAAQAAECFVSAWNAHDMPRFGNCFTQDADFVNVTGEHWQGRAAITRIHAFLHGTLSSDERQGVPLPPQIFGIFKDSVLTLSPFEIRPLRPDVAVGVVSWTMAADARTTQPRTGVVTMVISQQDGLWRIAAAQNTEIARTVR